MFKVRLSLGTAGILKLYPLKMDSPPTTGYFMIYHEGKCLANCQFCPQARESTTKPDLLSRIRWPEFPLTDVLERLEEMGKNIPLKRICIQTLNVSGLFPNLLKLTESIKSHTSIPISISCHPLKEEEIKKLHEAGVDRLGIPFDAATPGIFEKIKGKGSKSPYSWEKHLSTIAYAQKTFGPSRISTHVIVGLGETEFEAISFVQEMTSRQVLTGLFAFTPIRGTALESIAQPPLTSYRKIQLARYLIISGKGNLQQMTFNDDQELTNFGIGKEELNRIISSGKPFQTSGCQNCNRPYYNERPGKNLYNYPHELKKEELEIVKESLKEFL